jgi:hypothetical protein
MGDNLKMEEVASALLAQALRPARPNALGCVDFLYLLGGAVYRL